MQKNVTCQVKEARLRGKKKIFIYVFLLVICITVTQKERGKKGRNGWFNLDSPLTSQQG